jgi:prephenate dehydrogenase
VAGLVQVLEEVRSTNPAGAVVRIAQEAAERRTRMARARLVATAASVEAEAGRRTSQAAVVAVAVPVAAVAAPVAVVASEL